MTILLIIDGIRLYIIDYNYKRIKSGGQLEMNKVVLDQYQSHMKKVIIKTIFMVFHNFYLATSAPRQSSQRHSNPNPQNFPSQRGSDSRPNSLPGKIKFS